MLREPPSPSGGATPHNARFPNGLGGPAGTALFSAGFRPDYGWIAHAVTDELGFLRQQRGVTELPGLYCIGGLWQHDQGSAALFGMPRDARWLARHLGLIDHDEVERGLGPPPPR
ncbi:MAG: hypothetical protein ACLGIJ_05240 [Candidatus Limnocylindria bacterium]